MRRIEFHCNTWGCEFDLRTPDMPIHRKGWAKFLLIVHKIMNPWHKPYCVFRGEHDGEKKGLFEVW